ncbi:serine/threonine-protein kinase Pink1, mitochondrial-like [Ptychodera flava]|uniref:serine/threonine-protein kinase Pink1, mitochondrial-like n=1 Tax=Ptychodera flava TaxID=63121 RepID=UPI003969FF2C
MSVRAFAGKLASVVGQFGSRHGFKRVKEVFRGTVAVEKQQHCPVIKRKQTSFTCAPSDRHPQAIRLSRLVGYVFRSPASDIGKRFLRRGRIPAFAFVGVAMAFNPDNETKPGVNVNEEICDYIKDIFGARHDDKSSLKSSSQTTCSLADFDFGNIPLGIGCNGAVFPARWKTDETSKVSDYNLAIKMIYNFNTQSNHSALVRAYKKEILPLRNNVFKEQNCQIREKRQCLPSHPNIIEMHHCFTDNNVECIPDLINHCPAALPRRVNPNGFGRNAALFIVMKRYDMSLKQYLELHDGCPTQRVAMVILAQLLEGVHHLTQHNIAHRDLKCDNILVELPRSPGQSPKVAITDFGCCLADSQLGIKLPFTSEEVDRGGNSALMAPEVKTAKPGPNTVIDYRKSDLWAVGTIAYELLGLKNPFDDPNVLDSMTYRFKDLPDLPSDTDKSLVNIIKSLLKRNPNERPTPVVAATMLHLLLWKPTIWQNQSQSSMILWLMCIASKRDVKVKRHQQRSKDVHVTDQTEDELLSLFLKRVNYNDISEALTLLCDET